MTRRCGSGAHSSAPSAQALALSAYCIQAPGNSRTDCTDIDIIAHCGMRRNGNLVGAAYKAAEEESESGPDYQVTLACVLGFKTE